MRIETNIDEALEISNRNGWPLDDGLEIARDSHKQFLLSSLMEKLKNGRGDYRNTDEVLLELLELLRDFQLVEETY